MLESLISIESLLAVSVGAVFSFKIAKVNISVKTKVRNQSPDIAGNGNIVIYNNEAKGVKDDITFAVKLCVIAIFLFFHSFPEFFLKLLFSFSLLLPFFCLAGVVNVIRVNGIRRGWDGMYFLASIIWGVVGYCAVQLMSRDVTLYPNLSFLFDSLLREGVYGFFNGSNTVFLLAQIAISSLACAGLIVGGFYLAFGFVTARDGNGVFSFSAQMLIFGYALYFISVNVFFNQSQRGFEHIWAVAAYPFNLARYLFAYLLP